MLIFYKNYSTLASILQNIKYKMINPRIHGYGQFRKTIKNYSYFLNDKIGHGYSSTVYKGINDITNEKVAIKVIQLKFIKDQHTQKLLQTQLECIKKINHRYLLKFIDTYETTNNIYIITQYCEGGDLQNQLNTKGRFTQNQLIKFYAQFYQGYVNLMEASFIHRDLKPANILIKNGKIRIADFGIVKKANQNPKDNYTVGTLVYMAPESLVSGIVTQKSDVWAIGIMLYQLTHGHLPWKNSGNDKNLLKLQIQSIVFTFDSNWLSVECIKFISCCLDKDPINRISIKEMLNHPWMIPVIKLINESKLKNSRKNKTNVQNNVKSEKNNQPNISIKNVPNLFHNPNSATNIAVNGKINSQNQSTHKVPVLKFIYKNGNEAINVMNDNHEPKKQIASQSPLHRMRIKITGINPTQQSSMPPIPKPPQSKNKQKNKSIPKLHALSIQINKKHKYLESIIDPITNPIKNIDNFDLITSYKHIKQIENNKRQ